MIAGNIAMYLECLAPEALGPISACAALVQQLDALLRGAALLLHQLDDVLPLLRAATAALRIPAAANHKVHHGENWCSSWTFYCAVLLLHIQF